MAAKKKSTTNIEKRLLGELTEADLAYWRKEEPWNFPPKEEKKQKKSKSFVAQITKTQDAAEDDWED